MDSAPHLSVEGFVTAFPPPQRARVIQGYSPACGSEEDDEAEEFSTDDVIEIRRPLCPYVSLTFPYPPTTNTRTISVSTNYGDLFRVVTQSELKGTLIAYMYRSVQELIYKWPSTVKAMNDSTIDPERYYMRNDILKLLRVTLSTKDYKTYACEFKNTRTSRLFRLPSILKDNFQEVKDERVHTLLELIDDRRIPRILQFADSSDISIPWIPKYFCGYLVLNQPRILFEVKRIHEVEDQVTPEYTVNSILAIDLDIELSPRESTYTPMEELGYDLSNIVNYNKRKPPFIAQVTSWKEQTCVLNYNHIVPGNQLLIYQKKSVTKLVAECEDRYFLIPVNHDGMFKKVDPITLHVSEAIELFSSHLLPMHVMHYQSDKYVNLEDDILPVQKPIKLIETVEEDSLLVSKMLYNRICRPFYLPLRTGIRVRIQGSWKAEIKELKLSHRDQFAEEISRSLFKHLLMRIEDSMRVDERYVNGAIRSGIPTPIPTPRSSGRHTLPSAAKSQARLVGSQTLVPLEKLKCVELNQPEKQSISKFSTLKEQISQGKYIPQTGLNSQQDPNLKRTPPPIPPRKSCNRQFSLPIPLARSTTMGSTPSPRLPPRPAQSSTLTRCFRSPGVSQSSNGAISTESDSDSDSDDDNAYSYIDMTSILPERNVSGEEPIEIPKDGNLSQFSVTEMMTFLQESQVPADTVEKLRQISLDGRMFARMDDDELTSNGLASPIIMFFRNRSRVLGLLNQL